MTFRYRYRKQITIILVVFVILMGSVTSFIIFKPKDKKINSNKKVILSKNTNVSNNNKNIEVKEPTNVDDVYYKVDIKGYVNAPGIYELKKDSRVIDVINIAGGLKVDANTTVINLSKKIKDEMVIIIYSNNEVADFSKTKQEENNILDKCYQKDDISLVNDACIDKGESLTNSLISINTATLEQLMTLSGIGESKALDIIKYRETNGGFKSIDELKNVGGIGDSLFDKIKENITL